METLLLDLGISAPTIAIIVAAVMLLERLAKLIPDDAGGGLGLVRKAAKLLSGYTRNRKSSFDKIG
ncbi:MAG: hypothetical protein ACE5EM_13170 [Sphingomonadales bacterium]